MTEAEEVLYKKLQRLKKQREKLAKKIFDTQTLLEITCSHSKRKEKEEYIEGSYYDKAEYRKVSECQICGHTLLIHTEIGSYS